MRYLIIISIILILSSCGKGKKGQYDGTYLCEKTSSSSMTTTGTTVSTAELVVVHRDGVIDVGGYLQIEEQDLSTTYYTWGHQLRIWGDSIDYYWLNSSPGATNQSHWKGVKQ